MESEKIRKLLFIFAAATLSLYLLAPSSTTLAQYGTSSAPQPREMPTAANPLELWVFLDNPRIISGKMITLTVQAVWKLGVKVDLDSLTKVDLSPFKIEQITIGERALFDNTQDFRIVQYLLSLPAALDYGEYIIPPFSIPYVNEVDKTNGMTTSYPVTVRKVPILVETRLDKDIFDIGDRIKYTLTILTEKKDVKVLFENLERFNFEPFELLDVSVQKKTMGRLDVTVIEYSLAIYEIGTEKQQYEIPSIPVTYYIEPDTTHRVFRTEKDAIETKELKTLPVPVFINSLLKAVDIPLEGVKGPVVYPRHDLCKRCHLPIIIGTGILVFIGVFEFRRISRKISLLPKPPIEDTSEAVAERLRSLISSYRSGAGTCDDVEFAVSLDSELRVFLGTLVGISREEALSLTTSQFDDDYLTGRLPGDLADRSRGTLKQLDLMIFGGSVEKAELEKLLQEVEKLLPSSTEGADAATSRG